MKPTEEELRITELNAILENDLFDTKKEELGYEIELQFLQNKKNKAIIDIEGHEYKILYLTKSKMYMAFNANTKRIEPCAYGQTVDRVLETLLAKTAK